ncbi:MAG TPA: CDP-alcohol phosphatidyltransferase family protein [Bryobacteraceae bacterium]|nr:CDP-alcohol phosphatidyltransferase family protein [Bryobacteraceae bacterium]
MFRSLPNLLTAVRLVLVPFIAASLWNHQPRRALALVFLAGVTDAIDGWLARRFGWATRMGAYLDPVADKSLLVTLYLLFGITGIVPLWLTAIVLGRDIFILLMVAAGFAFTDVREFPPSVWGKLSTIVQIGAAVGFLANAAHMPSVPSSMIEVFVFATALATLWSGFDYGRRGFSILRRVRIDAGQSRR